MSDFIPFAKIARFSREVIVTEKIDGSNAQVRIVPLEEHVDPTTMPALAVVDGFVIGAGSRNRWLSLSDDNFNFAHWVAANAAELVKLGPGRHYGEWWGSGIQRGYGLPKGEKRFSLFNVARWENDAERPACCHVVPVIHRDTFDGMSVGRLMDELEASGSYAAPGFMKPEGIVIYHTQGNLSFKKTFEKDAAGKERGA